MSRKRMTPEEQQAALDRIIAWARDTTTATRPGTETEG